MTFFSEKGMQWAMMGIVYTMGLGGGGGGGDGVGGDGEGGAGGAHGGGGAATRSLESGVLGGLFPPASSSMSSIGDNPLGSCCGFRGRGRGFTTCKFHDEVGGLKPFCGGGAKNE